MAKQLATFIGQFAKHPAQIGTFAPSTRWLARNMMEDLEVETADVVFELGAGTGAATGEILKRLKPDATFVAVEINPKMVQQLRRRFDGLTIVEGSAEHISEFRRELGVGPIDCVLCGVPWACLSTDLQNKMLSAIVDNMSPSGRFATLALLHGKWSSRGKHLRRELEQRFEVVRATRPVWRNFPPAFAYQCWANGNGNGTGK